MVREKTVAWARVEVSRRGVKDPEGERAALCSGLMERGGVSPVLGLRVLGRWWCQMLRWGKWGRSEFAGSSRQK